MCDNKNSLFFFNRLHMITIWIKPVWWREAQAPLVLEDCGVHVMLHTPCLWLVQFQGSGAHWIVFVWFGAKIGLATHREIASGSRCSKGLVPASSALPRAWPQISHGQFLQWKYAKPSLNLMFSSYSCLLPKTLLTRCVNWRELH